ncbi:MAG: hypothetical protein ACI3ZQ_10185 [Candidatus Cryptobacteroides sp.]
MVVKCIKLQDPRINRLAGCEVKDHLTLGKEYVVLAISEDDWFKDDLGPSVLLCDDLSEDIPGKFPYFIPMFYFEIVDNTPSKYWIKKGSMTAFAAFVENRYFYFDLSEDDQKSQEAYMKYRKLLYEEAGFGEYCSDEQFRH